MELYQLKQRLLKLLVLILGCCTQPAYSDLCAQDLVPQHTGALVGENMTLTCCTDYGYPMYIWLNTPLRVYYKPVVQTILGITQPDYKHRSSFYYNNISGWQYFTLFDISHDDAGSHQCVDKGNSQNHNCTSAELAVIDYNSTFCEVSNVSGWDNTPSFNSTNAQAMECTFIFGGYCRPELVPLVDDVAVKRDQYIRNENVTYYIFANSTSSDKLVSLVGKCDNASDTMCYPGKLWNYSQGWMELEMEINRKLKEFTETLKRESESSLTDSSSNAILITIGVTSFCVVVLITLALPRLLHIRGMENAADQVELIERPTIKNFISSIHTGVQEVKTTIPQGKNRAVRGISVLGDRLFVVHFEQSTVKVYNSQDGTPLSEINVEGLKDPRDLVGCSHNNCIYIADGSTFVVYGSIHKVKLENIENMTYSWKVKGIPLGLSVTSSHNLLVMLDTLKEFTTDGKLLRVIKLEESMDNTWQAVQLSTGQYAVCHGMNDSLHRLLIVDTGGIWGMLKKYINGYNEVRIIKSYGGERRKLRLSLPEEPTGPLNYPRHLVVDKNDNIILADCDTHTLKVFSPSLDHVANVELDMHPISGPHRLSYDYTRHMLYIGELSGRVLIVKLT